MVKAPVAGRIKTRLAREIGTAQATRFARQAAAALFGRLGRDPRWQTIIAITPDPAVANPIWPIRMARQRQGPGDLGQRMQRLFAIPARGPLVIIGTDIPGITPQQVAKAFHLLGSRDAVFGPAADGGYWLIGLRRRPCLLQPFSQVRWSGPEALGDTLRNLAGHSIACLATLVDVDSAAAYRACAPTLGRRVLPLPR
jgi:rSAM/selenodomain-associated transferase 1